MISVLLVVGALVAVSETCGSTRVVTAVSTGAVIGAVSTGGAVAAASTGKVAAAVSTGCFSGDFSSTVVLVVGVSTTIFDATALRLLRFAGTVASNERFS